ncbi:DUF1573 domain-containing protein [Parapedobacter luteus]|nr:DUF1573 domain-containing protein [Parapedobacter luteus]
MTADKSNTYNIDDLIIDEDDEDGPKMVIENPVHNFGKIKINEEVKHVFYFRNTGKQPLIIHNSIPTCGCTISSHPQRPIPHNATDSIVAVFKSSELGRQNKVINVISNSIVKNQRLTIVAEIIN